MHPRTTTAPSAALYPVTANTGETAITGFPGDLQDLFTVGIGEMLDLERASVASLVSLNCCAIEVCKSALNFPLFVAPFLETMTKSLQNCLELQLNWLNLLASGTGGPASSDPAGQDPREAEEEAAEEEGAEDFVVETFENY